MPVNALSPETNILNQLYKQVVPVNARTLIDTVRGDTSPITEANFSPDELAILQNVYETTRNRNKTWRQEIANQLAISEADYNKKPEIELAPSNKPGQFVSLPIPYSEYIKRTVNKLESFDKTKNKTSVSYNDYPDALAAPTFDSWINAIKKSYTDPAYRMKTTLGSFNVNETPEGAKVSDTYNFDARDFYQMKGFNLDEANAYDLWKKSNGPVDFLDMMMIKYAPKTSRPVNIQLPKSQK
jgi:hypothetical protein